MPVRPLAVALAALAPAFIPVHLRAAAPATPPEAPARVAITPADEPVAAPDPARLTLTTDRVVVFKDGHALFAKSASAIADAQGRVHTNHVPEAAVLGCFWAASEDGRPIMMRAEWVETSREKTVERACITLVELIRANVGRTLVFELHDRGRLTGTIVELLEDSAPPAPDATVVTSMHADGRATRWTPENREARRGGEYVVVDEAQAGRIVLPVANVHRIVGDLKTKMTETTRAFERTKRLTLELGAAAAGKPAKLRLFHFQPGVRWIPTYRLTELDPGPAMLTLQAEILNEAEDIDGAALDLVVGFPNFRFKGVVSPLSLEATLRNALEQAAPGLMSQQLAQVQFQNRAGEWNRDEERSGGAPAVPAEITGSGEQDLFVYSLGAFSLKKGARAAVPVWQQRADRRHLYTLDIGVVRDSRSGSESTEFEGSPTGSPLRKLPHQVWHQLELANAGKSPWTTGAILMMQGFLPVAQELLAYTSIGGKALVPVTVAVDIRAEHGEEEIDRKPNALLWNHTQYALVRKRAEVTITNRRPEAIELRVRLGVAGKVLEASDDGAIVLNDFRAEDWRNDHQARVNNHSDVTWNITLKPGETRTVTYAAQFYVY